MIKNLSTVLSSAGNLSNIKRKILEERKILGNAENQTRATEFKARTLSIVLCGPPYISFCMVNQTTPTFLFQTVLLRDILFETDASTTNFQRGEGI